MEEIWNNIVALQGQDFYKIGGGLFSYVVIGDSIQVIGNRPYSLSRVNFQNALQCGQMPGPGAYPQQIVGPSYVWALLHDHRVNQW